MEEIIKTIKQFIQLIGAEVEDINFEDNTFEINLKAFGLVEVIDDIQFILKKIIQKQITDPVYINVDINNYKKNKEEQLKQAVQIIADQVALFKKEKTLNPMSSYERRIVHLELSQRLDIKTESIGEDKSRKIIIKPI